MRSSLRLSLLFALTGALYGLCLASPLAAQQFPGFGSIEGRIGAYSPDNADVGFGGSVGLGLGYIASPILRTMVGFNYFAASVNRESGSVMVTGDLAAVGGWAGLRLDPFGASRFTPYLAAAVTGHSVSVDADSPSQQDLLDDVYGGFLVGGSLGGGITYSFDEEDRYALVIEGRRVFVTDISHWAAEAGIRITPRGRDAYTAVLGPVAVTPAVVTTPAETAEAERAAAERERLRLERERLEAERLRAEQERQRMAQMTEEERLRAQQEAERLRQRADTLEAARQREAEARTAAEREAAAARAAAETAQAAAREAQQRAEDAERRAYNALLDLDRLITNITEIRETERGVAVVLGQGLFASGQSSLSPAARNEVGQIAAVLSQYPDRRIAVEGHTDAVGSEVTNQRLSEQRAEAVRAALIAQGVDPNRIDMAGYGESRPVADNSTAAGRAQNRRVEITILGARRIES